MVKWASNYFPHGDVSTGVKALEDRNALENPPPTLERMSAEDLAESTSAAGDPGRGESLFA